MVSMFFMPIGIGPESIVMHVVTVIAGKVQITATIVKSCTYHLKLWFLS